MTKRYRPPHFNIAAVELSEWSERKSKVNCDDLLPLTYGPDWNMSPVGALASAMLLAKQRKKPVIFFLGGHVIKEGLTHFIVDMINRGYITHLAGNGAVAVHDWELARHGETSEDVAKYLPEGKFGMWASTHVGICSAMTTNGVGPGTGLGTVLGEELVNDNCLPTVMGTAYRNRIPCTIHPLIGGDVFSGPFLDGSALGRMGWCDFLIFTESVRQLGDGGVFVNVGSAVHGPEIFLKALSLARNHELWQRNFRIENFSTAVLDLYPLPENWRNMPCGPDSPHYYFRPWKTVLSRSVAGSGWSYYLRGRHRDTIPALYRTLLKKDT